MPCEKTTCEPYHPSPFFPLLLPLLYTGLPAVVPPREVEPRQPPGPLGGRVPPAAVPRGRLSPALRLVHALLVQRLARVGPVVGGAAHRAPLELVPPGVAPPAPD